MMHGLGIVRGNQERKSCKRPKHTWDSTENGGDSSLFLSSMVCSAASGILRQVGIGGSENQ